MNFRSEALLEKSLHKLPFSEDFILASKKMGFGTLSDIFSVSPENMMAREGFSYHWLSELGHYLKSIDALHLLQQAGENNPF